MREKESGMITLEVMFIFPMVFFVVMTLCYMTFYLCDHVRLQGMAETMALEQALAIKDGDRLLEPVDYARRKERGVGYLFSNLSAEQNRFASLLKQKAQEMKLLGKVEGVSARLSHRKVEAEITMSISTGLQSVHAYMGGNPFRYQIKVSIPVHNPTEFGRAYLALEDTIESVKGVGKAKEKIKDLEKVKIE